MNAAAPEILAVETCASTNSLMRSYTDRAHGFTIAARRQTAGRGQRGNTWEAAPDCNLTFSMLLRPAAIGAARQFELSMLVALAVAEVVEAELSGCGEPVAVKWPNDIYVGNRKICGMLIENALSGSRIDYAIAGIGINVNQDRFFSDAPNPVSMVQIDGQRRPLQPLLERLVARIARAVASYGATAPEAEALLERYRAKLWHGAGEHSYHEPGAPSFRASVVSIAPSGHLTLSNGRTYAFKEVVQEL